MVAGPPLQQPNITNSRTLGELHGLQAQAGPQGCACSTLESNVAFTVGLPELWPWCWQWAGHPAAQVQLLPFDVTRALTLAELCFFYLLKHHC